MSASGGWQRNTSPCKLVRPQVHIGLRVRSFRRGLGGQRKIDVPCAEGTSEKLPKECLGKESRDLIGGPRRCRGREFLFVLRVLGIGEGSLGDAAAVL